MRLEWQDLLPSKWPTKAEAPVSHPSLALLAQDGEGELKRSHKIGSTPGRWSTWAIFSFHSSNFNASTAEVQKENYAGMPFVCVWVTFLSLRTHTHTQTVTARFCPETPRTLEMVGHSSWLTSPWLHFAYLALTQNTTKIDATRAAKQTRRRRGKNTRNMYSSNRWYALCTQFQRCQPSNYRHQQLPGIAFRLTASCWLHWPPCSSGCLLFGGSSRPSSWCASSFPSTHRIANIKRQRDRCGFVLDARSIEACEVCSSCMMTANRSLIFFSLNFKEQNQLGLVSFYRRQLILLHNMTVLGSSP